MLTRQDLAKRFNISQSTIRLWEREFEGWLNSETGVKGQGKRKEYTENDVIVLTTVNRLRQDRLGYDEIRAQLSEELKYTTAQDMPPPPMDEDTIALSIYMNTVRALEATEGELNATRGERDRLLGDLLTERDQRLDAERRAAHAEGKLEAYKEQENDDKGKGKGNKKSWLKRLFGGIDT